MGDRRVLGFAWLALAACLYLVVRDVAQWLFTLSGTANPEYFGGSMSLSGLISIGVTVGVAVFLWKHKVTFDFCLETVQETRKVVWPTKQETRDQTVVVIITSVLIAMMLWGFDQVFKRLFAVILNFQNGA